MIKRLTWSALAFGVTLTFFPVLAGAATPTELLAKHKAFMGWVAGDPSVPGVRLTIEPGAVAATIDKPLTAEENAQRALRIRQVFRGLLMRNTEDYGKITVSSGFTGRIFWRSNVNANTVTLFDDDAREALSDDIIESNAVTQLGGTSRGSARVRERAVEIVRVDPQNAFPIDCYIDPASGELLRYVIRPDDRYDRIEVQVEGYKEIAPGKRVIGITRRGKSRRTLEVTSAAIATDIKDTDFVPPEPTSSWTFGTGAPFPITEAVRYGLIGSGRSIQFRARFNGVEGNFLLDSGASGIVLYKSIADRLNLTSLAATGYTGVNGGFVAAREVKIDSLMIGDNVLHDVIVQTSGQPLTDLDGIIGYDFFAQAIVDVDLVKKTMAVYDPAKTDVHVEKGAVAFPVNLSSRTPQMPVRFSGGATAHPIFDSGDDFFVLLSDDMRNSGKIVALAQKLIGDIDLRIVFGGVDGSAEGSAPCVRLNRVDVGPYGYENVPVCFGNPAVFGKDGGLVGFDFLRHFNWTFDYPEGKLVLTPNGR